MPDLGGAYVTVSPDLQGFRERLQADMDEALAGSNRDLRVGLDLDDDEAKAKLADFTSQLHKMGAEHPTASLRVNADEISLATTRANLEEVQYDLQRLSARPGKITLRGEDDIERMRMMLTDAKDILDRIGEKYANPRVELNGFATAESEVGALSAALDELEGKDARAHVDVDGVDTSLAKVAELDAGLDGVGRKDEHARVSVDGAGESTAGINALKGALIGLAPALVPLAALAAGSIALLPGILSSIGGSAIGLTAAMAPAVTAVRDFVTAENTAGVSATQQAANVAKLKAALDQLSPATRQAVDVIGGQLYPALKQFEGEAGQAFFSAVMPGLRQITPLFEEIKPYILADTSAVGNMISRFMAWTQTAQGLKDVTTVMAEGHTLTVDFTQAFDTFMEAFTRLGAEAQPLVDAFGQSVLHVADAFNRWTTDGNAQQFLSYLESELPTIKQFVDELAKTVVQLGEDWAPLGGRVLSVTTDFVKFVDILAKAHPLMAQFAIEGVALFKVMGALGPAVKALSAVMDADIVDKVVKWTSSLSATGRTFIGLGAAAGTAEAETGAAVTGIDLYIGATGLGLVIGGLALAITYMAFHWQKSWKDILQWTSDAANFIIDHSNLIAGALAAIGGPIGLVLAAVIELATHWKSAWNDMQIIVSGVGQDIQRGVALVVNGVLDFFGTMSDQVSDIFKSMVDDVVSAFDGLIRFIDSIQWPAFKIFGHTVLPGFGGLGIPQIPELFGQQEGPYLPGYGPFGPTQDTTEYLPVPQGWGSFNNLTWAPDTHIDLRSEFGNIFNTLAGKPGSTPPGPTEDIQQAGQAAQLAALVAALAGPATLPTPHESASAAKKAMDALRQAAETMLARLQVEAQSTSIPSLRSYTNQSAALQLDRMVSKLDAAGLDSLANQLVAAYQEIGRKLRVTIVNAADKAGNTLLGQLQVEARSTSVPSLRTDIDAKNTAAVRTMEKDLDKVGLTGLAEKLKEAFARVHDRLTEEIQAVHDAALAGRGDTALANLRSLATSTALGELQRGLSPAGTAQLDQLVATLRDAHTKALDKLANELLAAHKAALAQLANQEVIQGDAARATMISDQSSAWSTMQQAVQSAAQDMATDHEDIRQDMANAALDLRTAADTIRADQQQMLDDTRAAMTQLATDQSRARADILDTGTSRISDQAAVAHDQMAALAASIADKTQIAVDKMAEHGLTGLALQEQQAKVALDQLKALDDAKIARAQVHADQVKAADDARTAAAQAHLDRVTEHEDAAVARAKEEVDRVTTHQAQLVAQAQAHLDAVTLRQEQEVTRAQAHLDSVTEREDAKVSAAQLAKDIADLGTNGKDQAAANLALAQAQAQATKQIGDAQAKYNKAQEDQAAAVGNATRAYNAAQAEQAAATAAANRTYTSAQSAQAAAVGAAQDTLNLVQAHNRAREAQAAAALAHAQDAASVQQAQQQAIIDKLTEQNSLLSNLGGGGGIHIAVNDTKDPYEAAEAMMFKLHLAGAV